MAKNENIGRVATSLHVITTNGAPLTDLAHYPKLTPYNVVTVYGRPGQNILAECTGAKLLEAAAGDSPFRAKSHIGEFGHTSFHVYMDSRQTALDDTNRDAATLTISDADNPDDRTDVKGLTFNPYTRDATNTVILGYASSTGAPADGESLCSVYLAMDLTQFPNEKSKYVEVELLRATDAWMYDVPGHEQAMKIWLNEDGTATANIVSRAVQSDIQVKILTPIRGDNATVTMSFVAPLAPH